MTEGWREIATLGHDDSIGGEVLCAWLAEDASHAWLFDDAGCVHFVRRGASERESRSIVAADATRIVRATFAGQRSPTLWLESTAEGPLNIASISRSESPQLRAIEAVGTVVRTARSGAVVLVRRARTSCVYRADGALVATFDDDRDGVAVSADESRCWLWRAGRFLLVDYERELHCDIALDALPSARAIDRTRLAIWSVDGSASIVDARRGTCVPLRTTLAKLADRDRAPYFFAPNGFVGVLRDRLAWQPYDDTTIHVLPLRPSATIVACDARWLVADEHGQVVWLDLESGEASRSDSSPVESLAFLDRGDMLLAAHRGGVTRYWSLSSRSLVTEEDVEPGVDREFAGLRPDARSALFIERYRDGTARIVERALVGVYVETRWSSDVLRGVRSVAAIDHEATLVACENRDGVQFVLLRRGHRPRGLLDGRLNRATIAMSVEGDDVRLDWYTHEETRSTHYVGKLGATNRLLPDAQRKVMNGPVVATSPAGVVVRASPARVHLIAAHGRELRLAHEARDERSWVIARDAARCASVSEGNTIDVFDIERGKIARIRVSESQNAIRALALSEDGRRLAVGLVTGVVRVFEFD
ncbi:MAG: hypothetical protein JNK05_27965 [Myxococcales bacterium]|nr:hypothetical protein [Myxococcales bacterium]